MEAPIGDTAGRVQIRELDDSRLEQAVRLWESDADGDAESPFSLAEVLAAVAARQPALVATMGETVVGAVAARVDGERAWVLRWAVAAESRRRGVGADLLRTLERRLQALGVREISMLTAHGEAAVSAAQAAGYILQDGTTFAKAIAGRLGWAFVEVFPSQLAGVDAHGRAGALRDLFGRIVYLDRVVVFIDEVEEIASIARNDLRPASWPTSC